MDHLFSARRPNLVTVYKEIRTCRIVDFTVLANHRVKLKKKGKKDKYLDLAKKLKKNYRTWKNMNMIPIVIGALDTVTKGLIQRLEVL